MAKKSRASRKATKKTAPTPAPIPDPVDDKPDVVSKENAAPRGWARSDGKVPPGHSSRNNRALAGEEESLLSQTRREPEVESNVEQFLIMAIMELCDGDTTNTKVNDGLQELFTPTMNARQQQQLLQRIQAYLTRVSKIAAELAKHVRIK
jgi:hypothetical protein